jgi:hypothetical protein
VASQIFFPVDPPASPRPSIPMTPRKMSRETGGLSTNEAGDGQEEPVLVSLRGLTPGSAALAYHVAQCVARLKDTMQARRYGTPICHSAVLLGFTAMEF